MALKINEIFYSIQGESTYAGSPCVFVRLSGCNLRCSFCDTKYAYEEGEELDIDDILTRVAEHDCSLVEVTGGEPLLQKETPVLIDRLIEKDYEVLLETNGTQDISHVDERCVRILDVKCPSSGESDKNDLDNIGKLKERDEIKFVIGDRADYEYAKKMLVLIRTNTPQRSIVHFSPVFRRLDPKQLADWILEDHLDVRLHLQLHKVMWGPDRTGV